MLFRYAGNQGYNQPMMQGQPINGRPVQGVDVRGNSPFNFIDRNMINRRNRGFIIGFGFMMIFAGIMLIIFYT